VKKIFCIIFYLGLNAYSFQPDQKNAEIDLSLINQSQYNLSGSVFEVRPTLGRGLRDLQNSAGGSACTSCAH
jgi:hypothetical protein